MSRKELKIGLFGFGCVGSGLYSVLNEAKAFKSEIVKICVKDKSKVRTFPKELLTFDKNEILENENINVVVELIDDAEAALEIVKVALSKGKAVVSANKKMIAENLQLLLELQEKYKTPLLYEASCCASIPIIRNLEEYYDNDLLTKVEGIFNGSTNYILTKVFSENLTYPQALFQAQELGFAESKPILDVEGFDAKYKLAIIIAHSFGIIICPEDISNIGITKLSDIDFQYATEKGYTIKLVAQCIKADEKVYAVVSPKFIRKDDSLYGVNNEYNAVVTQSSFSERQTFIGKGAGSYPTASATLSDISALSYDYKYEYKKIKMSSHTKLSNDFYAEIYLRYDDINSLDKSLFEEISETYQSNNHKYIIGKISWQSLLQSGYLNDINKSVVLFNGLSSK